MKNEDKRQIVYCARVATRGRYTSFGFEDEKPVICFVSRAKLYAEKTRNIKGELVREGAIEFEPINNYNFVDRIEGSWDEEGKLFIKRIFDDYKSCREYVDKQNEYFLKSKNIGGISLKAKWKHDNDVLYARELEEKYIPLEERQSLVEYAFDRLMKDRVDEFFNK